MSKKGILAVLIVPTVLLLIPLAGNMFVEGWDWNPGSFVFAWVMMAGAAWRSCALTSQENIENHASW